MDGVVDGVVAQLLGFGGDGQFAFAGAGFCLIALFEVGFGVPYDLSQELCDAGGVVCLLKGIALEGIGNFRIAFAFCLAAHGKVHTHLRAFAGEVVLQTGPYFRITAFGNANHVLTGPLGLAGFFFYLYKFLCFGVTYRAFCGGIFAFVYVSAHQASEFLFHIGSFYCV